MGEAGQVCGAAAVAGLVGVPGVDADEVDGHGGEDVLEEGFGCAAVAGLVDVAAVGGLGDEGFDAGA